MSETTIYCTKCNEVNSIESEFCSSCGAQLSKNADVAGEVQAGNDNLPFMSVLDDKSVVGTAFAPIADMPKENSVEGDTPPVFAAVESVKKPAAPIEVDTGFTKGLPDWDIEPPQVMVRRRKR